jgi:HAD superfamily phosphoserine phosphatase-like hydrolase
MAVILSDIEGTLTTGSSWRALRTYYLDNYSKGAYHWFFVRWLPRFLLVKLGLISRRRAMLDWMVDEVRLFRGMSPAEFDRMAAWVVEHEMWAKRREGLISELAEHHQDGVEIAVVSSGYQPIVAAFARRMDAIPIGSSLAFEDGKISGLHLPINAYERKAEAVRARIGDAAILAAYGDTLSDLPMLELSQAPVAVCPDADLRKVAETRGWRIIEAEMNVTT